MLSANREVEKSFSTGKPVLRSFQIRGSSQVLMNYSSEIWRSVLYQPRKVTEKKNA